MLEEQIPVDQAKPQVDAIVKFCNSKSIELFGFDPTTRVETPLNEEHHLKEPRFIQLDGNKHLDEDNTWTS